MNQRIKELADQASLHARADNSSMLFENFQKRYTEKFAELIVQDCCNIVDNYGRFLTDEALIKKIKRDLGVKE